jgi:hypothetical protein
MVLALAGLSTMTRFLLMNEILRLQRNAFNAVCGCPLVMLSAFCGVE